MTETTTTSDSADLVVLIVLTCALGLLSLGLVAALILWFWHFIGRIFPDPPEQ